MSWTRTYHLALHLLPAELRRKHGYAMESLFARDLTRSRDRGLLHGWLAGVMGVWDVVRRGAYELLRARHDAAGERPGERAGEGRRLYAYGPHPASANLGDPHMPQLTTRRLLRRLAASFAIAFVLLTASLLIPFATRIPALSAGEASAGTIAVALLLALPFTAAMTIPMAVLVAVLREFIRLRKDGTLAAARRERDGVRRLVVPVLGAAFLVAALALVVTAEIVPRANGQLASVLAGGVVAPSDRTMTIGELREAARTVRADTEFRGLARVAAHEAAYEVEVQKKLALPAACVVLALVGMAVALRVPRGGTWLVIGASCAVFAVYYMLLVAGEYLADQLLVSPVVGMWGANVLLVATALLAMWTRRPPLAASGGGTVVIRS